MKAHEAGLRPHLGTVEWIAACLEEAREGDPFGEWDDEPDSWSKIILTAFGETGWIKLHDLLDGFARSSEDTSLNTTRLQAIEWAESWMNARERQLAEDQAMALLEAGFAAATRSSANVPSPNTVAASAIDDNDVSLLAFLNKNPSLRRKVTDVLPEAGPQDRKAVANRLRGMADREPPLVDYPKNGRKGVAILPAGQEALRRATTPTPH